MTSSVLVDGLLGGRLVKNNWSLYRGGGIEEPLVVPRGVNEPWLVGNVLVLPHCKGGGNVVFWRRGGGVIELIGSGLD